MIRKNYYLKKELADLVVFESKRLGISQSSALSIIIDFYYMNHILKNNFIDTSKFKTSDNEKD